MGLPSHYDDIRILRNSELLTKCYKNKYDSININGKFLHEKRAGSAEIPPNSRQSVISNGSGNDHDGSHSQDPNNPGKRYANRSVTRREGLLSTQGTNIMLGSTNPSMNINKEYILPGKIVRNIN